MSSESSLCLRLIFHYGVSCKIPLQQPLVGLSLSKVSRSKLLPSGAFLTRMPPSVQSLLEGKRPIILDKARGGVAEMGLLKHSLHWKQRS